MVSGDSVFSEEVKKGPVGVVSTACLKPDHYSPPFSVCIVCMILSSWREAVPETRQLRDIACFPSLGTFKNEMVVVQSCLKIRWDKWSLEIPSSSERHFRWGSECLLWTEECRAEQRATAQKMKVCSWVVRWGWRNSKSLSPSSHMTAEIHHCIHAVFKKSFEPHEPAIPLQSTYVLQRNKTTCPYKNLSTNVCSCITYCSQKVVTTWMSIHWWMDKWNLVYGLPVKVAAQVNVLLKCSHNHIRITTKLQNSCHSESPET